MTNYPLWVLQQLVVQEHIGIEEMYDVTIHVFGVALVQTLTKYLHSSSYDCKPIVSMIGGKHSTSSLTPCLFWSGKYCNIGVSGTNIIFFDQINTLLQDTYLVLNTIVIV